MIIDAHYHLEERLQPVEALLAEMGRHHVDRVALIAPGLGLIDFKGIRGFARWLPKLLMSAWPQIGMFFYDSTLTADRQFSVLGTRYPIYDVPDNAGVAKASQQATQAIVGRTIDSLLRALIDHSLPRTANTPGVNRHSPVYGSRPCSIASPLLKRNRNNDRPELITHSRRRSGVAARHAGET